MINRILIRIKVVQMLYSYLLTRSEFRIDDAPESASRDRRYAYSAYLDLLLLIEELCGYSVKNGVRGASLDVDPKLRTNKVAKALSQNDDIRALILRGTSAVDLFDPMLQNLHDKITASAVYRDYAKKRTTEFADDVTLWTTVLETIIAKDPAVEEAMRRNSNFTQQGKDMAIAEAVATLKSYADSRQLLKKAKKDLETSLDKAYELYLSLFQLIIDITDMEEKRLENAKTKYIVSAEDLNPNTRFIDNALVQYLKEWGPFNDLMDGGSKTFTPASEVLVKTLHDKIIESDLYKAYISEPVTDFAGDVAFWRDVMRTIILPSTELAEDLEERSVFWNDDLEIMGTFVVKTLRRIERSEGRPVDILPKYKDEEDSKFGPELFKYSIDNYETYRKYIDMFVNDSSWDPERLAYMDIVIMVTAIAELINYPQIPVPVTVNEYVEIANNYSAEKSGAFINGILFSVIKHLNEEGVIRK